MIEELSDNIDESEIPIRVCNAIVQHTHIRRYSELAKLHRFEVLDLYLIGVKAMVELDREMELRGLKYGQRDHE